MTRSASNSSALRNLHLVGGALGMACNADVSGAGFFYQKAATVKFSGSSVSLLQVGIWCV